MNRWARRLQDRDVAVPLPHRAVWTRLDPVDESWWVGVTDGNGDPAFGFAAHLTATRAVPGHRILRVRRLGGVGADPAAVATGLRALADAVRADGRVLRAHVELHGRDPDVRSQLAESCATVGFQRAAGMRGYRETIEIDLSPEIDEIFMSLHSTGRRHVRAVGKNPTEIRTIHDPRYAERMDALLRETMSRTDGPYRAREWARIIEVAASNPDRIRLVGLTRTDISGPDALLAFAVGYAHGDHVEYATAASTRRTDLKMPLAYALAWDLIRWAKEIGADWFDFGGVTRGSHDGDDPRGGISDFKRYFSKNVVPVRDEWILEPHPVRAALGRVASGAIGWIRSKRQD